MLYFLLNLAIVGVIVTGIVLTHNPLFILGLMLLRDMPSSSPVYMMNPVSEESSRPIGFTADL